MEQEELEKLYQKYKEDTLNKFYDGLNGYIDYWANVKITSSMLNELKLNETEYRLSGLVFSILVMLDGDSGLNDFTKLNLSSGPIILNKDGYNLHENWKYKKEAD